MNCRNKFKKWCVLFAEWIGDNYEQDNGSVIGNVYYDRITRKDYSIPELWEKFEKLNTK